MLPHIKLALAIVLATSLLSGVLNPCAFAQGSESAAPGFIGIGGGDLGVIRGEKFGNGVLLYQWRQNWHGIHPNVLLGFDGDARYFAITFGYGHDFNDRLRLSLSTGPGLYERHDSAPNLGSSVEFLTTLELSWRIHHQQRIAVAFGHISNAHLADYNPGSEMLEFLYLIPID